MQDTILLLRKQLNSLLDKSSNHTEDVAALGDLSAEPSQDHIEWKDVFGSCDVYADENTPTSVMCLNDIFSQEDDKGCNADASLNSQVLVQVSCFS